MPSCFLAKNTFLHICDEREFGDSHTRSHSTPPCAHESGLKSVSIQQQYADYLTRTEQARDSMLGRLHGLQRKEVAPTCVSIDKYMMRATSGSDSDKSYSPRSKCQDGIHHSSRSTSVSTHRDGPVPDLPESDDQQDQSLANLPDHLKAVEGCSTLMISNIPCGVLLQRLAAAIDSSGFAGKYDSLHLPGIWNKKSNMGYGFIKFPRQEDAIKFAQEFDGHRFEGKSNKIVRIKPARAQGRPLNQCRLGSSHRAETDAPNSEGF